MTSNRKNRDRNEEESTFYEGKRKFIYQKGALWLRLFSLLTKEEKMKKMKSVWWMLVVVMLAVTGCNTLEGAGKDVERTGEKIEDAAK